MKTYVVKITTKDGTSTFQRIMPLTQIDLMNNKIGVVILLFPDKDTAAAGGKPLTADRSEMPVDFTKDLFKQLDVYVTARLGTLATGK